MILSVRWIFQLQRVYQFKLVICANSRSKLWYLALNINFKKVDALDMKNPTDAEYHNSCNIYRIYDLNIRNCRSKSLLSMWLVAS